MLGEIVEIRCLDCGWKSVGKRSTVPKKCRDCLKTNLEITERFETRPLKGSEMRSVTRKSGKSRRKK